MGRCKEINEILRIGQACGQPSAECIWACVEKRLHQTRPTWHLVCSEGNDSGFWNGLLGVMLGGGMGDTSAGRCCPSASDLPELKKLCSLKARAEFVFFPSVYAESGEVCQNTSLGRQVASASRCLSHLVGAEFQQAGAVQPRLSSL